MPSLPKGNIYGSFVTAAGQRQQEQQQIEDAVLKREQVPEHEQVPAENEKEAEPKRVKVMLSMTAEEKQALKMYAVKRGETASGVVQGWIHDFCSD